MPKVVEMYYTNVLNLLLVSLPRQEERKPAPGNLVSYITAVLGVVRFSPATTGEDVSPTYRRWARGYGTVASVHGDQYIIMDVT